MQNLSPSQDALKLCDEFLRNVMLDPKDILSKHGLRRTLLHKNFLYIAMIACNTLAR